MLVTTLLAMPTTLLTHASQEGTVQKQFHSCSPRSCNYHSTKKVVGISTVCRKEHALAQTHKVECTRQVLPEVIINVVCCQYTGLKVVEVAHDYQPTVQKYMVDELKLLNLYDMWHGKIQQYTILQ